MQLSLFQSDTPAKEPEHKAVRASVSKEKPARQDRGTRMKEVLGKYVPAGSLEQVIQWLLTEMVQLKITNSRSTKLGDYRMPRGGKSPVITVNHNLNPFAFLVTLVHEMAHHAAMKADTEKQFPNPFKRKRRKKPHGPEWQGMYRKLMAPYLQDGIFPEDIKAVILQYLENPKASTTADRDLYSILRKYDAPDGSVFVENLSPGAVFQLRDGRRFRKGEKVRTRFKCISLSNGKMYLFNPMAQVFLI